MYLLMIIFIVLIILYSIIKYIEQKKLSYVLNIFGLNIKDFIHFNDNKIIKDLNVEYIKYHDGCMYIESEIVDGKKNGITKIFYPNNHIQLYINYKNDIPHGEYKKYYENGILKEDGLLINGKFNGTLRKYREDGTLEQKIPIVNNEIDGFFESFSNTGHLNHSNLYVNGKLQI